MNKDIDKEKLEIEVNAKTCPAIINIPENAVQIIIKAKIIDKNLNINEAYMALDLPEITEARIEGEEWDYENIKYVLNPDFAKEFEEIENG